MPDLSGQSTNRDGLPQELLDKSHSDSEENRLKAVKLLSDNHRKEDLSLTDEAKEELERLWEHDKSFDVRTAAKKALDRKPNNNEIPLWKKLLISTAVLVVLFGILEFTRVVDIIPGFPRDVVISPEDVVKNFFDAINDGDIDEIMKYSSVKFLEEIDGRDGLVRLCNEFSMNEIEVISSEINGDRAGVTFIIAFDGVIDEGEGELLLILKNGRWLIFD